MNRIAYLAGTPERSSFEFAVPLSPQVSFIPAPAISNGFHPESQYARGRRLLTSFAHRSRELVQNNVGLLFVASSQLFFSIMNLGVKALNSLDPPVPAMEVVLVRMAITWICCVAYMYFMNVPDPILGPKGVRWFLIQRGLFGFFGIYGMYYSLQYLSLSDSTVLSFLSPMFTALAGAVFLHEAFSWREAAAGLASLVGVMLIARPTALFGQQHEPVDESDTVTPAQRLTAVGVALLGAVGAAGAYTTIRHIGKRAHPLHNVAAYAALCVIVSTIAIIAMHTPVVVPTRWDWLLTLLFIGVAGFGGQVLLTLGLQRERAGRGAIAVYIQIVFATIFERVFFHTSPSLWSIVGTVIIIGSALYVALTKKPQSESTRNADARVVSDDPSVGERLLNPEADDEDQHTERIELPEEHGTTILPK